LVLCHVSVARDVSQRSTSNLQQIVYRLCHERFESRLRRYSRQAPSK
jgi:hypothetical protein